MSDQMVDPKIVDRVRKLLALAGDGGATEGEANTAMGLAQKIMRDNNLSMATIELSGGNAGEGGRRMKDAAHGEDARRSWAQYQWQRDLMTTIGEVNFVAVALKWGRTTGGAWKGKTRVVGYELIGRESNVVAAKEMFTYLITTINRLLLAHNGGDAKQNMSKYSNSWKEGCADRLMERLTERHEQALKEQKREANERNAAARHPSAATGSALVVVMEDYALKEKELNEDLAYGYPPGTMTRRREEREQKEREQKSLQVALVAQAKTDGASERELSYMEMYSCTLAQARVYIKAADAPDTRTEKQKEKDAERERREQQRAEDRWYRQRQRERQRLDPMGYRAGVAAGNSVGLDKQVTNAPKPKLGN